MSSQPSRLAPASFLKHAGDVAGSYGFRSLREVEKMIPQDAKRPATRGVPSFAGAAALSVQAAAHRLPEPILAYWATNAPTHVPPALAAHIANNPLAGGAGEFSLLITGVSQSVAEVVLLKAVTTILNEWGADVERVRLNALGDKDSKARFEREVTTYVRKHIGELDVACQDKASHDPMAAYHCEGGLCRAVTESGPRAMSFLSEKSRAHFREVLEHLEKLSLPYEFDDLLLGDDREQRVVFAFDLTGADATVLGATGGRYDDYLKHLMPRKEFGGVGASIYFRKKGLTASHFHLQEPSRSPSVYFIQLGTRAKLEGLHVSDALRRARVPVLQSFDSSRLSHQLLAARSAGVSHLIIMGEREALDRTVLIRTTDDNSQQIVGVGDLPRYLKALR